MPKSARALDMPWRCRPRKLTPVLFKLRPSQHPHSTSSPSATHNARDRARVTHATLKSPDWPRQKTDDNVQVKIAGLVRSVRKQKRIAFAHIQDGSDYEPVQATMDPELATDLSNGAYAELTGIWKPSPGKGQSWELEVESVAQVGESKAEENPIQKQSMTTEYLRSIPHMRIRTPFQSLTTRVRSRLIHSVGEYFEQQATSGSPATQVQPPIVTSSDCEGAGEVFTISPQSYNPLPGAHSPSAPNSEPKLFFRDQKYLTVSSQLHLEAWSAELGDVWALSPTFRAEESDTSRHLAEFYMLEAEYRGVTTIDGVIRKAESLIKHLSQSIASHRTGTELLALYADHKHRSPDWKSPDLEQRWSELCTAAPWPQITYANAIHEIKNLPDAQRQEFHSLPTWNGGLSLEHERWIVQNIGKGLPTIVTHYPRAQKPFYMLPSSALGRLEEEKEEEEEEEDDDVVACFDILLPHGYAEVCGGSLREHRLPNLVEAMRDKKLLRKAEKDQEDECLYPHLQPGESLGNLQWYADLRRFGSSPHGGFGLGFDRLLAYLTGAASVRDVVGFPRYWGRADC